MQHNGVIVLTFIICIVRFDIPVQCSDDLLTVSVALLFRFCTLANHAETIS